MLQQEMIECFRTACHEDERVAAALMFGSFAIGEGDEFSDIEFAVFIRDGSFDEFEQRSWLHGVSPVAAYFQDDFGHHTALFMNGVRGEFLFMRASDVPVVAGWQGYSWFPSLSATVVLDRSGELSRYASALVGGPPSRGGAVLAEGIALNFISLMLFGANLLNRGEYARAWALLGRAHENLLKLVRIREGTTAHWPTPSRALERELSDAAYARYLACTAGAESRTLRTAYRESWKWGTELFETVAGPLNIELPAVVIQHVRKLLDGACARSNTD